MKDCGVASSSIFFHRSSPQLLPHHEQAHSGAPQNPPRRALRLLVFVLGALGAQTLPEAPSSTERQQTATATAGWGCLGALSMRPQCGNLRVSIWEGEPDDEAPPALREVTLHMQEEQRLAATFPFPTPTPRPPRSPCTQNLTLVHSQPIIQPRGIYPEYPLSREAFLRAFPRTTANTSRPSGAFRRLRYSLVGTTASAPLNVVVLGGSVPKGHGLPNAGPHGAWPRRLGAWLEHVTSRPVSVRNLAVPGTNSLWLLAHWRELLLSPESGIAPPPAPDLVFLDYASNDMLGTPQEWPRIISATEMIVRGLLATFPRAALVYVGLTRGWTHDPGSVQQSYDFQETVYRPVLDLYEVPLVSFRDAIWPDRDAPPPPEKHLFDCYATIHPQFYVHQLIADVLAFSLTPYLPAHCGSPPPDQAHTATSTASGTDSGAAAELLLLRAPPRFMNAELGRLHSCTTYLSRLDARRGAVSFEPTFVGDGWHFDTTNPHKQGWLYQVPNASAASSTTTIDPRAAGSTSTRRAATSWRDDAREPPGTISFRVRFGPKPTLVLTYIKSFENFGTLGFAVGNRSMETVRKMVDVNRLHRRMCRALAKSKDQRASSGAVNSKLCRLSLGGMLPDPFTLDGFWRDRSSQTYVQIFDSSWEAVRDPYLRGNPRLFVESSQVPALQLAGSLRSRGGSGRNGATHASTGAAGRGGPQPLIEPESTAEISFTFLRGLSNGRSRFKLMSIASC